MIHPSVPIIYLELWGYLGKLWLRGIICVFVGRSALKSHTLPTSVKVCGHSHYLPTLVILKPLGKCGSAKYQGFVETWTQLLESIRLPWEPGCLSSSWFHFDLKSRPQIHPNPLALHPGKVLELSWSGSYLVSLLNLHLNSIPRVPDAPGVGWDGKDVSSNQPLRSSDAVALGNICWGPAQKEGVSLLGNSVRRPETSCFFFLSFF